MLDAMPEGARNSLDIHLRQAAKKELSKEAKEALADQAQNVSQRLTGLREQLEKQEQGCETPVTIEFYHCDHLGTPIALTDDQHEIVWAARLDPWGNVQEEFNPSGMDQDIRLPGQHHDRETGLYYNRHRYYDPGIGSYVNQDPIGLAGGVNLYGYVEGKPTTAVDTLGLSSFAASLPSLPQPVVDFAAGFGDTLSWGVTDKIRDLMDTNSAVDKCSMSYTAGEVAGVAASTVTGGAAGVRAAGAKGAGKEFSHWIPNRMGGSRSVWNGNFVSKEFHALSDPYRYRFMPKSWKANNPMPNTVSQQWDRIPNAVKGTAAGAGYGAGGAAMTGCDKPCP